jgi:hypothetical protein
MRIWRSFSVKNSYQGTADYADEKDTADEKKQHQRRTEGSQSAYIGAICGKKTVVREPQITRMPGYTAVMPQEFLSGDSVPSS